MFYVSKMEVRLLGPVEVLVDGTPLKLGGKQRRTLLAILAVNAGRAVSTDRFIDELWGESPPEAARKSVQAHIAHLRRTLNVEDEVLAPTDNGYILQVEPEALDIYRFELLLEEGRRLHQADSGAAIEKLEQALALFRGAPLTGLADDSHSLRVETSRIEELRLAAIEGRLEAQILTGDATGAAVEAERLVAEYPLRERLWGLLMLSLYLSGRQGEALGAFSRARLTLAEELGIEPSAELRELEQRMLDQDPTLERAPTDLASKPVAVAEVVRNPYKGLRAFDEADAADFFGRDDLTRRLLERVESRVAPPMVVLAGPSGAGKSSAVRAGLIPELRNGGHEVAVMFPGSDPLTALAKTIAEVTGDSPGEFLDRLRSGDAIRFEGVLIVDQFEEVFTMFEPEEGVDRFLQLIVGGESSIRSVVATIRADFLDHLLANPITGSILEESMVLVPPLQKHEIEAAVVGPAQRVGVGVDSDLVQRIVTDVQARSTSLPLLQFALTDTFERHRGESLTVADYAGAGGITGALARRADELYATLGSEHQQAARQLFLHLVSVTDEGEGIRRRVARRTLLGLRSDSAVMSRVIERFGSQRLLTFDQDPETGEATVEVAHEALITEWPTLAGWVEAARHDLRMRRRLLLARSEWEESGGDDSFLLSRARLTEMESWREASQIDIPEAEQQFLERSRRAEDAETASRSRRRRSIAAALIGAAVVASVLASVAVSQRSAAEEQARIVKASDLAADAVATVGVDPDLSILLAIEAVETTRRVDGSVLDVAEEALHRAVLGDTLLFSVPNGANGLAHFAPDGSTFIAAGQDPTTVQVWSVDPVELVRTLTGHEDAVLDAVYDPDGDRIASTSFDGTVRVWNAATGEVETVFAVEGPPPLIPVFSRDGSMLAASSDSGAVFVWDVESEELIWELPAPPGTAFTLNLDFSPDGSLLAVAPEMEGDEGAIHVWDLTSGTLEVELAGHELVVMDVGFSPDGAKLVSGSWDTTLRVWNTETWETELIYFGHEKSVWDLQVSSDGTIVASSGNNEAAVWNLETGETMTRFVAHDGIVDGVDLSPGNDLLLTGSMVDMTTRVWDITSTARHELFSLPGSTGLFGTVTFSPDGEILAASRGGRSVTLWEFPTGRELSSHQVLEQNSVVDSISFHPDGDLLAFADREGAGVVDIAAGEVIPVLKWGDGGVVSYSVGGALSAAGADGAYVWADRLGTEVRLAAEGDALALALHPSGETALISLFDPIESLFDRIEVQEVETGAVITTLTENAEMVRGIAFSPDGERFVTASLNSHVDIWSGSSFEHLLRVEPHTGQVMAVDVHPMGGEMATVGDDETVRIIDMETGTVRLTLPAMPFAAVDYSPDGRYLAATGPEGVVMVYMLHLDELVSEAKTRITRWWTEAECLQYLGTSCPESPQDFE